MNVSRNPASSQANPPDGTGSGAQDSYDQSYYESRGTARIIARPFDRKHIDRFLKKLAQAVPIAPYMSVLDLGCAMGYLSYHLAERCVRVVGVDVSPEAIDFARRTYVRKNLRFEVADILSWDPGERFDIILFVSLYEHFTRAEQDRALELFKNWLAPGGMVVAHTITAKSWLGRKRTREKNLGTIDFSGDLTHTCVFSLNDLKEHFHSHGYVLRGEYRKYGSFGLKGHWLGRLFKLLLIPDRWRQEFVIEVMLAFGLAADHPREQA